MYDIKTGDIIITIDGRVLRVSKESSNYLFGLDITNDCNFMLNRQEMNKLIKEVIYNG